MCMSYTHLLCKLLRSAIHRYRLFTFHEDIVAMIGTSKLAEARDNLPFVAETCYRRFAFRKDVATATKACSIPCVCEACAT